MFKNGNSYAFRVSKKDREFMNVGEETKFEKIVSPDGKSITFKKIEKATPNILEVANGVYEDHRNLMKRLEEL
ncbi:AbrB family transcriptional regulator [Companilactobacillus baiquanensis]|uniref:AbrB family transcriptional regulator n=1 Tax=Companilactobacillus baiquanensis TaxID=2486005 RepID=A0ABW1UXE3_9LACO|nr:AbrB family transcriptional regulator [Companilactobacillus baiquanensis]